MVTGNRTFALLLAAIAVAASAQDDEMSYQEFRKEIGSGQERLDYSRSLVGHDKIHTLVPEAEESGQSEDKKPSEAKAEKDQAENSTTGEPKEAEGEGNREENSGSQQQANQASEAEAEASNPEPEASESPANRPQPAQNGMTYISPSLSGGSARGRQNQVSVARPEGPEVTFGISIGEMIPVKLDESASNVQPGLIAVKVRKAIHGRERTLPEGTKLFAQSSSVIGSDRLFLRISKGVTPDGEVFQVRGAVFDDSREPGLAGRVVSDGRSLERATSAGVNTLGKELLDSAPLNNAGGEATEATLGQLLKEKEQEDSAQAGRPAYVVVAQPQKAIVQVERTF